MGGQIAANVHWRYGSYWTTQEGSQSTVQLHNNLVNFPITVTPVLYLKDGTAAELDSITLNALRNASLDINRILESKGLPANAEGSVACRYPGRIANALAAETLIVRTDASLSYTIPSYEERPASNTSTSLTGSQGRIRKSISLCRTPSPTRSWSSRACASLGVSSR